MASLNVRFVLPFWWRLYIWAVKTAAVMGVDVDINRHADFVVRHGKIKTK